MLNLKTLRANMNMKELALAQDKINTLSESDANMLALLIFAKSEELANKQYSHQLALDKFDELFGSSS